VLLNGGIILLSACGAFQLRDIRSFAHRESLSQAFLAILLAAGVVGVSVGISD
jgi:hypothetical protein